VLGEFLRGKIAMSAGSYLLKEQIKPIRPVDMSAILIQKEAADRMPYDSRIVSNGAESASMRKSFGFMGCRKSAKLMMQKPTAMQYANLREESLEGFMVNPSIPDGKLTARW
jgi:hypothetical protein